MTNTVAEQIAILHSKLQRRKLDDATLRLLQSILVSKHAQSTFLEIRNSLIEFTRSQATRLIQEIVEKTVEEKLFVLEFFVRAFAHLGDVESCLALRYEALAMRERVCKLDWLQVTYDEWLTFAKDSLENGYSSIAVKACENALSCMQTKNTSDIRSDACNADAQIIMKIKELKDVAVALTASHSIQAQAANHWKKKKTVQQNCWPPSSQLIDPKALASSAFRDGIKRRNLLQLRGLQSSTTDYAAPNHTTS